MPEQAQLLENPVAYDTSSVSEAPARLSAEELTKISQPYYERALAEMKAEWHCRFREQQAKKLPPN